MAQPQGFAVAYADAAATVADLVARIPDRLWSAPALAEAVAVLARTSVELGHAATLLAALTGRATLPPGFTTV